LKNTSDKILLHEGLLAILKKEDPWLKENQPYLNNCTILLLICHLLTENKIPKKSQKNFADVLFTNILSSVESRNIHPTIARATAKAILALDQKDYFVKLINKSQDKKISQIKNIIGFLK
jgi:hypothetical protein